MPAPSLPGLSAYPELEKKFQRRYREASMNRRCSQCERSKVINSTLHEIAARQRRDKRR